MLIANITLRRGVLRFGFQSARKFFKAHGKFSVRFEPNLKSHLSAGWCLHYNKSESLMDQLQVLGTFVHGLALFVPMHWVLSPLRYCLLDCAMMHAASTWAWQSPREEGSGMSRGEIKIVRFVCLFPCARPPPVPLPEKCSHRWELLASFTEQNFLVSEIFAQW